MNIGIQLRKPFDQIVERIHADLAEHGYAEIRPSHGIVFQHIGKHGARLTELAARAQMTKQSMSYLVQYLEDRGYIERKEDAADKRAVVFCITNLGWKVVAIAEQSIKDIQTEWAERLGQKKFDALVATLQQLNGA
jgi:DNA-binding MarR family transcriptional regulator